MRILLVEDEPETGKMVADALEEVDFRVTTVDRIDRAKLFLERESFDAVVLDWMLPDGSGVDLCRSIRAGGRSLPILMLTARGDVVDRVAGLDAGADDYMRKPFAVAELVARLRALSRRGTELCGPRVEVGAAIIDLSARSVTLSGRDVLLTAREFALLESLVLRRGRAVSRSEILRTVWYEESSSAEASLEVLMSRLRRKLSTRDQPCPIRTLRGFGYTLPR